MTINIEEFRADMKREALKFAVQLAIAMVAALSIGIAIGRFVRFHQ